MDTDASLTEKIALRRFWGRYEALKKGQRKLLQEEKMMVRRRQILATRPATERPPAPPPPLVPRPLVHRRRRALPEVLILRARLEGLTPIEDAVLRVLARCGRATPRDIVRHVRGVEDAHAILNRLVQLGLAARRPDDRRGTEGSLVLIAELYGGKWAEANGLILS